MRALPLRLPEALAAPAFAAVLLARCWGWHLPLCIFRYGSRVEAIRGFLAGDLRALISSGDFEGIKAATGKKGAVGSYLGALDLWAATYSDSSPSPKSVAMQVRHEEERCPCLVSFLPFLISLLSFPSIISL